MKISEKYCQTVLKYFQNKLPSDEKKNILKSVVDDRLFSDAIEGFESYPDALKDLNLLKNRFYYNKGIRNNFSGKYFLLLAGFLTIILSGLIIFYKLKITDVSKSKKIISDNTLISSKQSNLIMKESEISDALPLAAEVQITRKSVVINQPKTIVVEAESDANILSRISGKKIQNISHKTLDNNIEKELDKKLITYSNFPVIYILDLKTVDYSEIYKNRPVISDAGGLESKFESSETKTVFTFENPVHYISYKLFLETALQKYSDADFKGAIRDFSTILKTFPADLNALFYGGLCMYNLQKSDKAITYFDKVIESPVNSFCQEAKWYKALSLIQKNDNEKARKLIFEIINESGFYAEKAKLLLKNLK